MEIDYKAMFENLAKAVKEKSDQEREYFDLVKAVAELQPYADAVGENMMSLSIAEQIQILKPCVYYLHTCRVVANKHGLMGGDDF